MGVGPLENPAFRIVQAVVIRTILFRRRIGIRQWFVFSKWTKKYKQYKQLRKRLTKSWIMIMTITKEMKGKDNNGIYFCQCIR
jgi:hypothetical protein